MKRTVFIFFVFVILVTLCSCASKPTEETAINDIVKYCNAERKSAGLAELTLDEELSNAALVRAGEIISDGNFAHVRPDGSGCFTVIRTAYTHAGENLAKGEPDGRKIVEAWMNSEAHRKNVLTPEFTRIGLAYTEVDGVYYWAALFTD